MIIQLNPTIPVWVGNKGTGHAIGWIDYSQEHNLMWLIAFDETGEIWLIENPLVRLQKNFSIGRMCNEKL